VVFGGQSFTPIDRCNVSETYTKVENSELRFFARSMKTETYRKIPNSHILLSSYYIWMFLNNFFISGPSYIRQQFARSQTFFLECTHQPLHPFLSFCRNSEGLGIKALTGTGILAFTKHIVESSSPLGFLNDTIAREKRARQ